jgi:hypothetical protein
MKFSSKMLHPRGLRGTIYPYATAFPLCLLALVVDDGVSVRTRSLARPL